MTWSEAVWAAPVLRGLDTRAQREIEAAGAVLDFTDGQRIFDVGHPADDLFVVERGLVAVRATPRGEGDVRVLREVSAGGSFGEDATLRTGGVRQAQAVSRGAARVVRVPAALLARATERGGAGDDGPRQARRRAVARNAMRDWLRAAAFGRALAEDQIELLLDAGSHVTLARSEHLFHQGDKATHVYFVGDGLLQLQSEEGEGGRIRVHAYAARGDVLGEGELAGERRRLSAVAIGSTVLVAVERRAFAEIAARNADLMAAVRRVTDDVEERGRVVAAQANATSHVFQDLYRLQVARSLLVIDQESCVRCGHCAWSCASAHGDGVSRLVRRGDKMTTRVAREEVVEQAALLVPTSCQHCENPACMPDCPTGAIGRDARGEVFIREELCTGCGACARGCPWDNIQMAPRASLAKQGGVAKEGPGTSPEVAVKCDLCAGRDGGPACVEACPTEAVVRIKPSEVLIDVREALGVKEPARALAAATPAWPWVGGAVLLALAAPLAARSLPQLAAREGRLASGALATALLLGLAAYGPLKRRLVGRLRPQLIAHLALGALFAGIAVAHALPMRSPSALTAALTLSFAGSLACGALGALAYRVLPPRITAVERRAHLPEDIARRAHELDDAAFTELTGKSDVVKALFRRLLAPYRASRLSALRLALSGRTLRQEEARLRERAEAILGGRGAGKLEGLERLVRGAVERQALRVQQLLVFALRAWLLPHVVLATIGLVLVLVHAVVAYGNR